MVPAWGRQGFRNILEGRRVPRASQTHLHSALKEETQHLKRRWEATRLPVDMLEAPPLASLRQRGKDTEHGTQPVIRNVVEIDER